MARFPSHREIHRLLVERALERFRKSDPKRRRGKDKGKGEGGEFLPVEPDRPRNLEGGAAAALEYDD